MGASAEMVTLHLFEVGHLVADKEVEDDKTGDQEGDEN